MGKVNSYDTHKVIEMFIKNNFLQFLGALLSSQCHTTSTRTRHQLTKLVRLDSYDPSPGSRSWIHGDEFINFIWGHIRIFPIPSILFHLFTFQPTHGEHPRE